MEHPWSTPGDQVHVRSPAPAGFSGEKYKVEGGLKVLGLKVLKWSTPGVATGCWLLRGKITFTRSPLLPSP